VIETTIGGTLLNVYDIAFIKTLYGRMQPSGLAYGPSSTSPGAKSLYITDRAVDNDSDPRENDGKIHEISLGGGGGDSAPAVLGTTPAAGATNVAVSANIAVNFTETVTTSGTWFNISCATSGAHTATVSGGPQSFTLNPGSDFAQGESCTVRILALRHGRAIHGHDGGGPVWNFDDATVPPPSTGAISLRTAARTVGGVTGGATRTSPLRRYELSMFFDGSTCPSQENSMPSIVDGNTILFSSQPPPRSTSGHGGTCRHRPVRWDAGPDHRQDVQPVLGRLCRRVDRAVRTSMASIFSPTVGRCIDGRQVVTGVDETSLPSPRPPLVGLVLRWL
jgi:hypothetical protein